MENIPESIIDKLRKLKKLQESATKVGSLAEAENAAHKIQELLFKYNLEMSSVDFDKEQTPIDEFNIDLNPKMKKHENNWIWKLYMGICDVNDVHFGWFVSNKKKISLIGHKINIEITEFMCEQLIYKFRILAKESYKEYTGSDKKATYLRSFLIAATQAIIGKLLYQKHQMNLSHNHSVTISISGAVSNWIKNKALDFKPKTVRKTQSSSEEGFIKGKEAGEKLEINKGINSNKNESNQLLLN